MTNILKRLLPAVLLSLAFFAGIVFAPVLEPANTPERLIGALSSGAQPCFPNYASAQTRLNALNRDETPAALVGGGLEKGMPIPDGCFAVQTGAGGLAVTYWRQPYFAPPLPAWNPMPGMEEANALIGTSMLLFAPGAAGSESP